jgi:EAL domain-containing protein (putative c-di-GMP-specific phosphodiesterase class I)
LTEDYKYTRPIDTFSIDREFICDVIRDHGDTNLVSAIISLSHDMDMSIIGKGVENQQQFDLLSDKGCHLFQEYYFSRPITADEYLKVLKTISFKSDIFSQ